MLFIILLLLLNRATGFLLPKYWENAIYCRNRLEYFSYHANASNTLFFGSSRSYAHIDPILFDSINAAAGLHTNSYMLGSSSVFFNESVFQVREILSRTGQSQRIRYVFFELDDDVILSRVNLFTPKTSYFITTGTLVSLLRRVYHQQLPFIDMLTQSGYYISACIVNTFHIGYGPEKLRTLAIILDQDNESSTTRKGHVALSAEEKRFQRGVYRARHQDLLNDTMIIQRFFDDIIGMKPAASDSMQVCNQEVLHACYDLISDLEQHGTHLVFVLPLRSQMRRSLVHLYNALPDEHKIDMSKIAAHIPELHYVRYWFDKGHLNVQGVQIYTHALAKEVQYRFEAWGLE